jgi:hypothetical protein
VKIHFAEGIELEYEKEKRHVNWCAFGADTNKRQINRHERAVQKLMALRKTIDAEKPLEVRRREWPTIKVEPRVGGAREMTQSASLTRERLEEERRTKSRLGETGDCDGTFESGMGSGVCVEGDTGNALQGGAWTPNSVKERSQEVEEVMVVLSAEMKIERVRKKEVCVKRDQCKLKVEQSECLVGSYENKKVEKGLKIEAMVGEGGDVDQEKIKMEGIMEQLADEESRLMVLRDQLEFVEAAIVNMAHGIEAHRLQFDALAAELFQLRRGKTLGTFWPRSLVYSDEQSIGKYRESDTLLITNCTLCQVPFLYSDIIVSSCRYLYHPFCASVIFVHGGKCIAKGCQSLTHPEWHRSFGWGEPGLEMLQRALMLGCAEERRKVLQQRMGAAKGAFPSAGKFSTCTLESIFSS